MLVPSIASHRGRVRALGILLPQSLVLFSLSLSLLLFFYLSSRFLILVPSAILIYLASLLPPNVLEGRILLAGILPSFLSIPSLSVRYSTFTRSVRQGMNMARIRFFAGEEKTAVRKKERGKRGL